MTAPDMGRRGPSMTFVVAALEVFGIVLIVAAVAVLFGAGWALLAAGVAILTYGIFLDMGVMPE